MPEQFSQVKSDDAILELLEGTAAHTGPKFFSAFVKHLAQALNVSGAWVTELSADRQRLRALSFWFQDGYIEDFEYAVKDTPCGAVVERYTLFHVPENIIELFPNDPDLVKLNAVSYLGLPLLDVDGTVLGHLAALDDKPLPWSERVGAIFRIFGARAAAEIQRIQSENRTRDRERQLSSLLDSAWESILVIDESGAVCDANQSARKKLGLSESVLSEAARPSMGVTAPIFTSLLTNTAAKRWTQQMISPAHSDCPWWIHDLELKTADGTMFPAEASVSTFERGGHKYWTVILRDLHEQREAERRLAALREESRQLREELEDLRPVGQLIGECAGMRAVFGQVRQVAPTDATVLIHGETGTGKELVARAIHDASPRKDKALVRVNCGAIPAALMESEFFGHEKGAFTGATDRREGRFALADGGTLFLDEIGELPLDLQVKLLRVLQEGEFEPVGSARTRKVNVRIIAATNRNLPQEIERGSFRADLYYRLNVFPLQVPALRERGEDVLLLADAFVERLARRLKRRLSPLSRSMTEMLRSYDWPGNVRELENVLERAAILSRGEEIVLDACLLPAGRASAPSQPNAVPSVVLTAAELEAFERQNLIRALDGCGWRVAGEMGAAKMLGVAPSTLTSRMKALGVERSREKSSGAVL